MEPLNTFALATGGSTGAVIVLLGVVWTLRKIEDILGNLTNWLIKTSLILLALTLGTGIWTLFK